MFMADDQKKKEKEHHNEKNRLKNQLKNANLKIEELIRKNDYQTQKKMIMYEDDK